MADFWFYLCESFAPLELANSEAKVRKETVMAVTRFVTGQLSSLPSPLLLCLNLGLAFFRMFVLITSLRLFESLDWKARKKISASWAYGRIGLARQLFRPIRTLAIFAYYENPTWLQCLDGQDASASDLTVHEVRSEISTKAQSKIITNQAT